VSWTLILAALGAAICYAAGSVYQHREAHGYGLGGRFGLGSLLGLTARPMWLLGTVIELVGSVLHLTALSLGSVSVVQPLEVSSLLFALPMAAALAKLRIGSTELGAALLVVVGISLFLVLADPGRSTRSLAGSTVVSLVAATAGAVLLGSTLFVWVGGWIRGVGLGALSGGAFGVTAVIFGSVAHTKDVEGWSSLAHGDRPAEILAAGALAVGALALSQVAFQTSSLAAVLPSMTVTNPVMAVILGGKLLGERLTADQLSIFGMVAAVSLTTVGVIHLARARQVARGDHVSRISHLHLPKVPLRLEVSRKLRLAGLGAVAGLVVSVAALAADYLWDPDDDNLDRLAIVALSVVTLSLLAPAGAALRRLRVPRARR
jgi:hypothetical protein